MESYRVKGKRMKKARKLGWVRVGMSRDIILEKLVKSKIVCLDQDMAELNEILFRKIDETVVKNIAKAMNNNAKTNEQKGGRLRYSSA